MVDLRQLAQWQRDGWSICYGPYWEGNPPEGVLLRVKHQHDGERLAYWSDSHFWPVFAGSGFIPERYRRMWSDGVLAWCAHV